MHVVSEPLVSSFNKVGIQGKIFETHTLLAKAQFVLIETAHGHETTIVQHVSDFIYYILEGKGIFTIHDMKEECEAGNLVCIPAGTPFTYKGRLKMLLICTPPWKEEQEELIHVPADQNPLKDLQR